MKAGGGEVEGDKKHESRALRRSRRISRRSSRRSRRMEAAAGGKKDYPELERKEH